MELYGLTRWLGLTGRLTVGIEPLKVCKACGFANYSFATKCDMCQLLEEDRDTRLARAIADHYKKKEPTK